MNKLRKTLMLALFGIAILVVTVAPAAAKHVNEYEGQHIASAGDPSQWG